LTQGPSRLAGLFTVSALVGIQREALRVHDAEQSTTDSLLQSAGSSTVEPVLESGASIETEQCSPAL
jgi:hypothetical protein